MPGQALHKVISVCQRNAYPREHNESHNESIVSQSASFPLNGATTSDGRTIRRHAFLFDVQRHRPTAGPTMVKVRARPGIPSFGTDRLAADFVMECIPLVRSNDVSSNADIRSIFGVAEWAFKQ